MRSLLFIVSLVALLVPALSHAEIISSADNIIVDAMGKDASDARATAIAQGEQAAFKQIVEKMAPDKAEVILKNTSPDRVSALTTGYEVLEEKMANNRYRATLRYNFDPRGLARVLGGMPSAAAKPPVGTAPPAIIHDEAMLILPVWNDNGIMRLWETENIWRSTWNGVVLQRGEGILVSAFGDKQDMEDTDGNRALRADYQLLEPMAAKYGAKQIGIMLATVDPNDAKQELKVVLKPLTPTGPGEMQSFSYPLKAGETLNMQMQRAANDIALKMRSARGGESIALEEQVNTLKVRMQGVTMKQWETIRSKLLKVPAMQRVDLNNVSYFDTTMTLTYRGTPELLGKMLAAAGFRLFRDGDTLVLGLP